MWTKWTRDHWKAAGTIVACPTITYALTLPLVLLIPDGIGQIVAGGLLGYTAAVTGIWVAVRIVRKRGWWM